MSREREAELVGKLRANASCMELKWLVELLKIRREKHRDSLENTDSEQVRGRAKECKDIIRILIE